MGTWKGAFSPDDPDFKPAGKNLASYPTRTRALLATPMGRQMVGRLMVPSIAVALSIHRRPMAMALTTLARAVIGAVL